MSGGDLQLRITAAVAVLENIAGRDDDVAHNIAVLDVDDAIELPDEVTEWSYRRQQSPVSRPSYGLPLRVLAAYALGQPIPGYEEES